MEENTLQQKGPAIKRGWLRALLFLIAFLIATVIFQGITAVLIALATDTNLTEIDSLFKNQDNQGLKFIMEFVSLCITFLIAWIFRKFIDRKSVISMGFQINGRIKDIIYGILVGFMLMFLGFLFLKVNNNLEIISVQFSLDVVLGSFIFFLMAATVEEIVFRGYILNNLMGSFKNKYLALLISSIFFAAVHGLNPNLSLIAFINLIIAGLALGIAYIYTKNLWFPIFMHVSWNYFQGPIFGFEVSGMNTNSIIDQNIIGSDLITGGKFGFEGSILLSFLLIGMIVITDRILARRTT